MADKINPDFSFVRRDYRVRVASEQSPLHARVGKLVSGMYGARGLMSTRPPPSQPRPEEVTLAASSGHDVFGTLTLGVDSGAGLLADALYQAELDALRSRGSRLCEVTRLALAPQLSCPEVMATIFNIAFLLASEVHARTGMLAEVHPRHAGFYRRAMGYRVVGPERICERVRAPAVLMHLCLDYARAQIRRLAGVGKGGRSLYRLFLPPAEQAVLLTKLTTSGPASH